MALAYLLTIVAGTIEALFTMIWLFRGTAGAATSTGHKTIMEPCERWSPRNRKQTYAPDKNQFQADNRNCLYLSHVRLTRPLFANARECCVKRSCPLDCRPAGRRGSSNKSPKVKSQ